MVFPPQSDWPAETSDYSSQKLSSPPPLPPTQWKRWMADGFQSQRTDRKHRRTQRKQWMPQAETTHDRRWAGGNDRDNGRYKRQDENDRQKWQKPWQI